MVVRAASGGAGRGSGLELLRSTRDLVNLPIALAAGAALAARLGDPARAGTLWGAAEAHPTTSISADDDRHVTEYEAYLEPVRGDAFDAARLQGRTLSLE